MNKEKQNQEYYQETFREVHAPGGMAERLRNMEEGKNKKKAGSVAKWIAVAAVAAVALFAGSNGIAYATTGSTWVEAMVQRIKINGVEYEVDMEERQKSNGDVYYVGSVELGNGDVSNVKYEMLDDEFSTLMVSIEYSHCLTVKDGRAYVTDINTEIDVTDEVLENGQATGTYEVNGYIKEYRVWKDGEYYHHEIRTLYDGMEEDEWWNTGNKIEVFADPTPTPKP